MKIIAGIPSLNEQDSIGRVVQAIDTGLNLFFKSDESIIVNADSGSNDTTVVQFLNTPTSCSKDIISAGHFADCGKGRNVWELLRYGRRVGADIVALFDADVATIDPRWVQALITPVTSRVADFVAPLYSRTRFEGSTTSHFAIPLIFGHFGTFIRQPIGGEFAFGREVISYLNEQQQSQATMGYGIDVFLTMHALGGGFRINEAYLGKKLHKPSFPKLRMMFPQVAQSGLSCIMQYSNSTASSGSLSSVRQRSEIGIVPGGDFPHKAALHSLLIDAYHLMKEKIAIYRDVFGSQLNEGMSLEEFLSPCFEEEWIEALVVFIRYAKSKNPSNFREDLGELLYPFFVRRATSFWLMAELISASQVEELIIRQAEKLRMVLLT